MIYREIFKNKNKGYMSKRVPTYFNSWLYHCQKIGVAEKHQEANWKIKM